MSKAIAAISLLHGFSVEAPLGRADVLRSTPARRLLAYLATQGQPRARDYVAFTLWPETGERQANQNLRTAVWEVREHVPAVLCSDQDRLALASGVDVDFDRMRAMARSVVSIPVDGVESVIDRFAQELLPDWYDEWLVPARDRWLEARLHALDALAARLSGLGQHGLAIDAAVASVAIDPLRESSRRALILAHLAEGNQAAAKRAFERFREVLRDDLGVTPPPELAALLTPTSFRPEIAGGPGPSSVGPYRSERASQDSHSRSLQPLLARGHSVDS